MGELGGLDVSATLCLRAFPCLSRVRCGWPEPVQVIEDAWFVSWSRTKCMASFQRLGASIHANTLTTSEMRHARHFQLILWIVAFFPT